MDMGLILFVLVVMIIIAGMIAVRKMQASAPGKEICVQVYDNYETNMDICYIKTTLSPALCKRIRKLAKMVQRNALYSVSFFYWPDHFLQADMETEAQSRCALCQIVVYDKEFQIRGLLKHDDVFWETHFVDIDECRQGSFYHMVARKMQQIVFVSRSTVG